MSLRSHTRRSGRVSSGNVENSQNLVTKKSDTELKEPLKESLHESLKGFPGRAKRTASRSEEVVGKRVVEAPLKEVSVKDSISSVHMLRRVAFGDVTNAAVSQSLQLSSENNTTVNETPVKTESQTPKKTQVTSVKLPEAPWYDALPDYDKQDVSDPRFVSEYANSIFSKLWDIEAHPEEIVGDYMPTAQVDLNEKMRGVLVDWLVEVHWKFKLYPESLFLCVTLLDRFLSKCSGVPRNQLQLVGVTCLLIAAKYEDIYAPETKDIVLICDKTYRKEEILAMEVLILNSVSFQITTPSALLFLLRLAKVAQCDERQFYLAQYCLELGLAVYSLWTHYHPAQLASAALFLSNKLLRKSPGWGPVLSEMTGLSEAALKPLAKELCNILQLTSSGADISSSVSDNRLENQPITKAVKKKFSQPKFYSVAKMVL